MAKHTWAGYEFDKATNVVSNDQTNEEVQHKYPGLSGTEIINLDGRMRTIVISGIHTEADLATLTGWFDGFDDLYTTVSTLSLDNGATTYDNCRCRVARGRRFASEAGYTQEYTATFTQIYP